MLHERCSTGRLHFAVLGRGAWAHALLVNFITRVFVPFPCLPLSNQCLSNTQPLTEYFIGIKGNEKPYKKHINKDNPLGMGGAIAESYGALLEEVWSGSCSCVAPRQFKVGRSACLGSCGSVVQVIGPPSPPSFRPKLDDMLPSLLAMPNMTLRSFWRSYWTGCTKTSTSLRRSRMST